MCCISRKKINFMLVLVLCLGGAEDTIDLKELTVYLS